MAINLGPTLKRRRTWARLTQQELVDQIRIDRSASYISAIESGKTSPTLAEMELLARYFSLSVIELLEEASNEGERRRNASSGADAAPPADERVQRLYAALDESDRELALELLEAVAKPRRRRTGESERQALPPSPNWQGSMA